MSRIVLVRLIGYLLLENRLVIFFYVYFVFFILLVSLGRGSRCIGIGKFILLVFVEVIGKRIGLGENGVCRRIKVVLNLLIY